MKLLVVVPSFKILGGVANHYFGLSKYWKCKVKYSFQGKRRHIPALFTFFPDIIGFIVKILFYRPDVVLINPSLRPYQLKREAIYFKIAKTLGVKTIVTFIHGWNEETYDKIKNKPEGFVSTFGSGTFIYVLYTGFKKKLDLLNLKCPVLLTTTKVNDALLKNFNIDSRTGEIKNLLFLARIEESKGIFTTLKTFELLKRKYDHLILSVCGDGPALQKAKEYVKVHNISSVIFYGNLSGEALKTQFEQADIYILPTTWGEGMATSVLEAMAFGLPVITRPVGGVKDFFINGEMGYLIESINPEDYYNIIDNLINSPLKCKQISKNNYNYAKTHFLASEVTKRIEDDIEYYL